jgi:hypothetical protein
VPLGVMCVATAQTQDTLQAGVCAHAGAFYNTPALPNCGPGALRYGLRSPRRWSSRRAPGETGAAEIRGRLQDGETVMAPLRARYERKEGAPGIQQ